MRFSYLCLAVAYNEIKKTGNTTYKGLQVRYSRIGKSLVLAALCAATYAVPVAAQTLSSFDSNSLSLFDKASARGNTAYQAPFSGETLNSLSRGMLFTPAKGFGVRADAWRVGLESPYATTMPEPILIVGAQDAAGLFIDDSKSYAGLLEAPSVKTTVGPGEFAKGIDLSASYVWESPRFGQFILSTKATYLYDTAKVSNLLDGALPPVSDSTLLPKGAELQSSLMLTWQVGQHTASAVTHYFDSFEDLSKLNLEQLNELVGNMTTLDLQYGYNLKAGKQGQAVFSLGVRNLFDAQPDQLPQAPSAAIEQQGRVAYGSIKYQF